MEPVRVEFLMVDGMSARLTQAGRKVDALKGKAQEASSAMGGLDKASEKVRQTISSLAAAFTAKELVSKIATVRGEFQQLEVAFTTMLGSADKANALMAQLTETAATTPFGLQEVANGAKQLLAYGTEAEKVNETLVRLGDIAAGLSVPLGDLVYLYGTTMTQGRLYTQDLNQFTGRGIPMVQELAKQFGVAESKVKGLVEEGKVGFPEVQKVIESLTNTGGKFGGLMEAQSKTIAGQINNIEDSIEGMFNKIGQENEGLINDTLGAVSSLVENYEQVAKEVLALAAAYGTYKAVVITLSAIEKARLTLTLATGAAEKTVTAAQAIRFAMTNKLKAAQEALNAAMIKNPYTLVAAAVAALAYGIYKLATYQTDAEKAQKRLDDATKEYNKSVAAEQLQIDGLFARLQNAKKGTQEYENAKDAIISQYGTYLNGLDAEIRSLNDVEAAYKAVSAAARDAAKARAMETFTKDAADAYAGTEADEKEKLYQYLKKHYKGQKTKGGRDMAESIYWQLVGAINGNGKAVSESWLKQFDATHTVTSPSTGIAAYSYTTNEVRDILNRIKGAKTTYNTTMDEARRRFGDTPEEEEKKKTATTPTTQDYEYWEKKKKEAESQLKALDASKKGSKEWNKLQEDIRAAQAKMDSYSTSKTDSAAAKLQRQQAKEEKAEERQKQARTDLGEKERALELENQEEEIELMDEGREKKLKQIDKEYQQRAAEIEKKAHDLAETNKKAGETNVNGNGLTEEQQAEIDKANALNEKNKAKQESDLVKADAEAMREYLKQYGTYQQQKLAIAEEYAEKIKKAQSEGEKKTLEAERDRELRELTLENLQKQPEYARAFGNMDEASTATLRYLLGQFQEAIQSQAISTSDPEALQRYVDIINKIDEELTSRDPFGTIRSSTEALTRAEEKRAKAKKELQKLEAKGEKSTEAYSEAQRELAEAEDDILKNESKRKKAVAEVNDALSGLSEAFDGLGTTIGGTEGEILQAMGNVLSFVVTCSETMQTVSTTASVAIQIIEKASVILTIISAAIQLAQAISKLLPDADSEYEKYSAKIAEINEMKAAVNDYAIAVAEARAEERSWFSGDSLRSLKDYAETGKKALEAYTQKLAEQQAIYQNKSGGGWLAKIAHYVNPATWMSWIFGDNAVSDILGFMIDTVPTSISPIIEALSGGFGEYEEGTTAAINNLRIQTRAASKGFLGTGIGGHSEETEDLITWVKENLGLDLFNEDLTLNDEAYEVIMDKYADKLVGETKETLEELKEYSDKYEEYIEELESYVSDLYSPLVESFTDSLWNWFDDGKDALDSFKDYASDVFRDIVTDMLQSVMLTDFIDEFSETVKEAYKKYSAGQIDEDELMSIVTDATDTAMKTYESNLPVYQEMLNKYKELLAQNGIDLEDSSSSQTGQSGGFTAMTQDQGTKLEGMFTSGLQHWSSMDTRMEDVSAKMDMAEGHLAKIEENTGVSASHLSEIKEDLKKVIRDGLKVK